MKKLLVAIALTAALVLSACGAADSPTPDASPTQTSTPAATVSSSEPAPAPVTSTVVVTVAPPAPDATFDQLLSAQIPSFCDMGPQQLVNGEVPEMVLPDGQRRVGFLYPRPDSGRPYFYAQSDIAGLGHQQAIGVYACGIPASDGVWYFIIVVDSDGTTIGQLHMSELAANRVWPDSLQAQGDTLVVHWSSTEALGAPSTPGTSILSWRDGQLVADPA